MVRSKTDAIEVIPKKASCCEAMKIVLDYAEKWPEKGARLAGIQVAHVFDHKTLGYKGSPLVYVLPSKGRGKARMQATNILFSYCPFCGKRMEKME